jgi:predicted nucleic acid-binding protein
MLILVGTNVLLRLVEPGHTKHPPSSRAVRELRSAGHTLCVVPQVHYEFWVAATRPVSQNGLGLTAADAESMLKRLGQPLFRMLRDERAIYEPWRELVGQLSVLGKQAHDARLAAAMIRHGVTHLLTGNLDDFRRFSSITLIDPEEFRRDNSTPLAR